MEQFSVLVHQLDLTNKVNDKILALEHFFKSANQEDQLVALALFSGRKPKRQISARLLSEWCCEVIGLPQWLFEESYQNVGDLAETIQLLLPEPSSVTVESLTYWYKFIHDLNNLSIKDKKINVLKAWKSLPKTALFIFNKMITGGFRIGVNQQLVIKALSNVYGIAPSELTYRIMGNWTPFDTTFQELILEHSPHQNGSKPYPFCLANPITPQVLNNLSPHEFQVEWKWDGIRGQLIVRNHEVFLWSRGEELITDKFPELVDLESSFNFNIVFDGEILAYKNEMPLPFQYLQKRIGRKNVSQKMMKEVPVVFMAYDVLEYQNEDIRNTSLHSRRNILEVLVESIDLPFIKISPLIPFGDVEELKILHQQSRTLLTEGFLIKNRNSTFEAGRKKGNWFKWKTDPLSVDGVLIYAQKGHGRRAGLYTDFTFGVWDNGKLVPFAKAYSGLTNEEIKNVDQFVKQNTLEKFGPVRTVKPGLVFEIGFEGIQESPRHKSGIALRFPRILRWRTDKTIDEANSISDLKDLLQLYEK
jgi:DNA ligase 1